MLETFGKRLKSIRNKLGLSQEKFSKLIGISQFSLSFYENDKRMPDVEFLTKVKEMSNCDLNWLVNGNSFSQDISTIDKNDLDLRELIYWYKKHHIVQLRTLAVLEGLKIEYPELFEKIVDIKNKMKGGKQNEEIKIKKEIKIRKNNHLKTK